MAMSKSLPRRLVLAAAISVAAAPVGAQGGITAPRAGKGGSVVKGSAGTGGDTAGSGLDHCEKPMGALAVVEPQDLVLASLRRYNLQSPVGLIRLMIQQSNCFIVVERGAGMRNLMQERALASGGQLREDSNVGGGQMVAADFVMTPSVVFAENNAGGAGGALAGVFGRRSPVLGAVAGGLKFKEAQTSMLVADARSGVQVAAAEGSTRKADMRLGGALFGGGVGAAAGGYGNTNEGKIIAAAFMDNYNGIVRSVKDDPSLQRSVRSLRDEAAAGGTKRAGAVFAEGDVVAPKIGNVRLLAAASETAKVVATLARGEELVVVGGEKDGYLNVQSAAATGWIKITLVAKR
jgi:hypothetical protein